MKTKDISAMAGCRMSELESEAVQIRRRLEAAPPGKLAYKVKNGRIEYYLRKDSSEKTGMYIRKNDEKILGPYLQKLYDEKVLKLVDDEYSALASFIGKAKSNQQMIRNCYSELPGQAKKLIVPADMSDDDYSEMWLAVTYEKKPISPDLDQYRTDNGEYVRSKSELTIANALFKRNIPYRYECPLTLNSGITLYPDFTILNARTRQVYYWEHRGMMDDREYARASVLRQKEYIKSGYFPGIDLIVTEETSSAPLSTSEIRQTIQTYLV